MPSCDGVMPLGSQRVCSQPGCDTHVHHACCAEWYSDHRLPDPESNKAFCWPCIKKLHPEQAASDAGDLDGDAADAARGSRAGSGKRDRSAAAAGSARVRAEPGNTSSRYSGAEFEAGRQRNSASATQPLPGEAAAESPHPRRSSSEQQRRRSPRTPEGAKQAAEEVSALQKELDDASNLPWLGQTAKLDKVGQFIISLYEHRIIQADSKIANGEVVKEYKIKYRTKYEPVENEKIMGCKGFNQSRLGEYIFNSCRYTPAAVKLQVASMMRSSKAKQYVANAEVRQNAARDAAANLADESRKMMKTDGDARAKDNADNSLITKYISRDSPMPAELYQLNLFLMTLFFLMCRISFTVSTNLYFRKFLKALRPSFEIKLPRGEHLRTLMAGVHLDEAYERAKEITEEVRCAS